MVRVISVHHFDSQIIQTCEEPLAVCSAPPDRLLFALPHHVIEVREIALKGQKPFCFPTVDKVFKLSYCATGNYVATLEKKQTRQGKEVVYTRVYTNWDRRLSDDDGQSMRARIAGRVTPSSSQTGGEILEMIELPVKFPITTTFCCCQETGNILVGCERVLCLFQLVTRTHDISRLKFLDFELWPVTLELSFAPIELAMSEDVVAAVDCSCLHVFRINKGFARPTDWSSSTANSSPRNMAKTKGKNSEPKKPNEKDRPVSPVRLEELLREVSDGRGCQHETSKLSNGPLPVLAILPAIKCAMANNPARNLRASPFKPPGSVTMGVAIKEIPANEPWAEQMTTMVESLLQLELGNWDEQMGKDEFKCLALRPQYKINNYYPSKTESSCPRMRSQAYCNLVAFNCLICTRQEGFMYHFPVYEGEVMSLGKCISEYNFTSPIRHVILEPYLLHALTTTGLETYTLRTIHAIEEDIGEITCPPADEPVCLIGLKPFIGAVNLIMSNSYVVILSSSETYTKEESMEQTIYCLRLPSPGTLYTDMLALASSHRFTNPLTYSQLLAEAHAVLRTITQVHADPDFVPLQMEVELFRESSALFAEYYLACDTEEEWEMGYKYSILAQLNPTQLMDRLKKLDNEAKGVGIELKLTGGLIHYLKMCLIACDEEDKIPVGALNTLLDLIEARRENSKSFLLSSLILESSVLRQFSTERTIRIISNHVQESKGKIDVLDCLALAVLYITKGKTEEAGNSLALTKDNAVLIGLLEKHWTLLFDNTRRKNRVSSDDWEGVTLSELAVLLINKKPNELSQVMCSLVINSILQLHDILQVFLTYLPARIGTGGTGIGKVLQIFLESVFQGWYCLNPNWKPDLYDSRLLESLKILMRSYLSDLVKQEKSSEETFIENLFGGKRPPFLNLLPPFSLPECNWSQHTSLLKLQCLLCSGWLDESTLSELVQFVGEFVPEEIGFSLLVLAQPTKAVKMMADKYPNVLPQYAQDMLNTEAEWKHLISVIQSKADEETEMYKDESPESRMFTNMLEEVLNYLARSLSCDVFTRILPPGKEFEGYILKCQQTAHASHLKDMIMVTGHRLMATMNLKSFT